MSLLPEGVPLLISTPPKLKLEDAISIATTYYGLEVLSCKGLGSGTKHTNAFAILLR